MKNYFIIAIVLLGLIISSCNRGYYAPDYHTRTADHQEIAVLPVYTLLLGNPPRGLSQEDIREIEEVESLAFQRSMARAIQMADSRRANRQLVVSIQSINTTNRLLQDNNIDLREAWTADPVKLAEILQVDAVVSMRVEKYRYFSDLASVGITIASDILFTLSQGTVPVFLNPNNKDVIIDCEVIDGTDGGVLWSISHQQGADWRQPANQLIDNMTWQTARQFPYLQKRAR